MAQITLVVALFAGMSHSLLVAAAEDSPRPNILWIISEDNGPHLRCYDDAKYPLAKIVAVAEQAASLKIEALHLNNQTS